MIIYHIALNLLVCRGIKIFIPCVAVGAVAVGDIVKAAYIVVSQALPDLGVVTGSLGGFELFEVVIALDTFVAW
jgi:hypothetical protein